MADGSSTSPVNGETRKLLGGTYTPSSRPHTSMACAGRPTSSAVSRSAAAWRLASSGSTRPPGSDSSPPWCFRSACRSVSSTCSPSLRGTNSSSTAPERGSRLRQASCRYSGLVELSGQRGANRRQDRISRHSYPDSRARKLATSRSGMGLNYSDGLRTSLQLLRDAGAEDVLLDLPEAGDGKLGDDLQPLGVLVAGQAVLRQERGQLRQLDRLAGAQDGEGAHLLAQHAVRHGHAGHVEDGRVHQQQVLDLFGADLLAAAIDDVLLATFDHVVAVL